MMADFEQIISSPTAASEEGLAFFRGQGMLNRTLLRAIADLERNAIDYALIGAVALNQHGYKRFTEDIAILMTKEGLKRFQQQLVGLGYRPAYQGATKRFKTSAENVSIEVVTTGEYPGDGLPKPVVFPDPSQSFQVIDGVKTITLEKLIELQLASGMTAPDRLKDLADVQEILKIKGLGPEFAGSLDESVREKFHELQQAIVRARTRAGESEP
jgi:hypothetical protein